VGVLKSASVSTGIALAIEQAAERTPDSPVLLDEPLDLAPTLGVELSYERLATLIQEANGALAAAGITRGECVAVVKRPKLDTLVLAYALMRLGAVPALISPLVDDRSRKTMLERLKPAVLLTDRETPADARAGARLLMLGSLAGHAGDQRNLADYWGAECVAPVPARDSELAMILHSSGTTGVPKLVAHSARSVERIAYVGRRQALVRLTPLGRGDLIAACLAWTHGRAAVGYALAFAKGSGLLALSDPRPGRALELIARHQPTIVETHPNILLQWQRGLEQHPDAFRNVRLFVSTADAIHPATVSAVLRASDRRAPFYVEVYGMTEMGPATVRITRHPGTPQLADRRNRIVGRPIPGFSRARVVDPATGKPVRRGRAGAIEISTRASLETYVGEEQRYREQTHAGWFRTGDIGVKTPTGVVRLLDREVDRVNGVTSCVELEEILLARLPEAREIVVVAGINEQPTPVVATDDDLPLDRASWERAMRGLPNLAEPVQMRFDEIPFTATWKVRRFLVREHVTRHVEAVAPVEPGAAAVSRAGKAVV
jgi:acyl-coenzyme A synthetase/AMP-(fatty) acid ligase